MEGGDVAIDDADLEASLLGLLARSLLGSLDDLNLTVGMHVGLLRALEGEPERIAVDALLHEVAARAEDDVGSAPTVALHGLEDEGDLLHVETVAVDDAVLRRKNLEALLVLRDDVDEILPEDLEDLRDGLCGGHILLEGGVGADDKLAVATHDDVAELTSRDALDEVAHVEGVGHTREDSRGVDPENVPENLELAGAAARHHDVVLGGGNRESGHRTTKVLHDVLECGNRVSSLRDVEMRHSGDDSGLLGGSAAEAEVVVLEGQEALGDLLRSRLVEVALHDRAEGQRDRCDGRLVPDGLLDEALEMCDKSRALRVCALDRDDGRATRNDCSLGKRADLEWQLAVVLVDDNVPRAAVEDLVGAEVHGGELASLLDVLRRDAHLGEVVHDLERAGRDDLLVASTLARLDVAVHAGELALGRVVHEGVRELVRVAQLDRVREALALVLEGGDLGLQGGDRRCPAAGDGRGVGGAVLEVRA